MDIILKQRLVGAIVLISLGVIFIPMLLSGKGDLSTDNMKSNIPPTPKYQLRKPLILVPESATTSDTKTVKPSTPEPRAIIASKPASVIPVLGNKENREKEPGEKESDKKIAVTKAPAKNEPARQVAQVSEKTAPVSKQASAKQQAPTITKPGSITKQQTVSATATNQAASSHPTKNQSTASLPTSNKAERSSTAHTKSATTPAVAVTGWVVQVGSFEQRSNANQLRDKLRKKGFASFVEPRKDNHAQHVYRVRVGPKMERSAADDLQQKLLKQVKLNGIVMHYPTTD